MSDDFIIEKYEKKYLQAFIDLNIAWLEEYFKVEQADLNMLYGADELVKSGAMIYFALLGKEVAACCMVAPRGGGVWEICKLATADKFKGRGAGSAVLEACINFAKERGAEKLLIITNHILIPAVSLYKKYGFKEVSLNFREYERADLQFELKL